MHQKRRGILLALMLLIPGGAAAQTSAQPQGDRPRGQPASLMEEDVEIFRRLLNDKLQVQYHPLQGQLALANNCQSCHATSMGNTFSDWVSRNNVSTFTGTLFSNQYYPVASSLTQSHPFWRSFTASEPSCTRPRVLDSEGVYLKGYGVVYTVTVAGPPRKETAEVSQSAPRPLSDWDRMRSEVRQEKAKPAEKSPPRHQPTLAEIILKVLAENGRHFTQLGDNENLTVVVTFRTGLQAASATTGSSSTLTAADNTTTTVGGLASPKQAQGTGLTTLGSLSAGTASGSSTQDYELLGDLHLKQGKGQEAITAYQRALEQKPEPKRAAKLQRKLAQAYLEQGKDVEAHHAIQAVLESLTKAAEPAQGGSPKATESPRSSQPAKLIISTPRRLLDQVGTGQLSVEAFQKAATADYVNFPSGQK
jgi:hypothetical protein